MNKIGDKLYIYDTYRSEITLGNIEEFEIKAIRTTEKRNKTFIEYSKTDGEFTEKWKDKDDFFQTKQECFDYHRKVEDKKKEKETEKLRENIKMLIEELKKL